MRARAVSLPMMALWMVLMLPGIGYAQETNLSGLVTDATPPVNIGAPWRVPVYDYAGVPVRGARLLAVSRSCADGPNTHSA